MSNSICKYRNSAFQSQSGLCYYCNDPMWITGQEQFAKKHHKTLHQARQNKCTGEHLIARQDGGKITKNNIVAACLFCNRTRHRMSKPLDPELYKAHVVRRVNKGRWKYQRYSLH